MDTARGRSWAEFFLPVYAMALIYIYLHPEMLPHQTDEGTFERFVLWGAWALIGTLAGILAVSAAVVAFYLLYSPLYLVRHVGGLFWARETGTVWTDRQEVQFYVVCFLLLCGLAGVALYDYTAGAVAFVLLSGVAPLAWRIASRHR